MQQTGRLAHQRPPGTRQRPPRGGDAKKDDNVNEAPGLHRRLDIIFLE
jgi:hypothetical protein